MKNELYQLAQDTEALQQTLSQLQEYNREIKVMIDKEEDEGRRAMKSLPWN